MRLIWASSRSGREMRARGRSAQECVQEATHTRIFVAEEQQTLRYCANPGVCAAFSFAIGTLRGQDDPHAPSPRAKLQATRVRGPTDDGRSSPQGSAGSIGLIGGCDGVGVSRPRSRLWPSDCAREYAAVDEQILPGDVAGLGGAQKGAGGAEFVRRAEALGGR